MTKIAVVLSGCGVHDGSEIYEATLTLLHLAKNGAEAVCVAPDIPQSDVIDHRTGNPVHEERNVLTEAARLARGKIRALEDVSADDVDGVIFPGGFGAAKNLSDFAVTGDPKNANVTPSVAKLVNDTFAAGKPLGFICIAPAAVAAVVLREKDIKLTIGNSEEVNQAIEVLGNRPVNAEVDEIVVDEEHNVVSTPAYMLATSIVEAEAGISKLVKEVVRRARG